MQPKFKISDNVVCLSNNLSNNHLYNSIFDLEIGKIYTVAYCDYELVRLLSDNPIRELIGYDTNRFVSLRELRKQKIKKICLK